MLEDAAADGDAELSAVGEVERTFAPRLVHLLEHNLTPRPVQRPPHAETALQRPRLLGPEPVAVTLAKRGEDRRRVEHALVVALEQRHDLALPHALERIAPRAPPPRLPRRARQRPALPLARRPLAHPGDGRRCYLGLSVGHRLPQQSDLLVRDHPRSTARHMTEPVDQTLSRRRRQDGSEPAEVVVVDRQK